jgi:hypothetical protein
MTASANRADEGEDVSRTYSGRATPVATNMRGLSIMGAMVAWLAITNAVLFGPARTDALYYREMAASAPGLPDEVIGSAYTGRLVPHYLVGLLAEVSGASLHAAYVVSLVVVVTALLVVLHLLLRYMSLPVYALLAGIVVLSPYAFRPYLASAWNLQDLVFVLGTAVCLLGLLHRRSALVLLGLAVAICGRQSALPLAPVAALWVLADPAWRAKSRRLRLGTAMGVLALVVGVYSAIMFAVAPFSKDYEPHIPGDTVLALLQDLPSNARSLVAHLGRSVVPLLVPGAVLVATLTLRRTKGLPWLSWPAFGCLTVGAAIIGQPIAIDPAFPGFAYNEQRLVALGLLPLAVAIGLLLAPVAPRRVAGPMIAMMAVLLSVSSLHHLFTRVGPPTTTTFLASQAVAAVGIGIAVWALARKSGAQGSGTTGRLNAEVGRVR